MRINYNKETFEIFGVGLNRKQGRKIKLMLFPFKTLMKDVNIKWFDKKSFVINCSNLNNFNNLYGSIEYAASVARGKGLGLDLELIEYKGSEPLINKDKDKIRDYFNKLS